MRYVTVTPIRCVCNSNERTHAEPQTLLMVIGYQKYQLLNSKVKDLGQPYLSGGEKWKKGERRLKIETLIQLWTLFSPRSYSM